MLSGGNQTDRNSFERFLTPYQNSRLPLRLVQGCSFSYITEPGCDRNKGIIQTNTQACKFHIPNIHCQLHQQLCIIATTNLICVNCLNCGGTVSIVWCNKTITLHLHKSLHEVWARENVIENLIPVDPTAIVSKKYNLSEFLALWGVITPGSSIWLPPATVSYAVTSRLVFYCERYTACEPVWGQKTTTWVYVRETHVTRIPTTHTA